MLTHILKMIWTQRRSNGWIFGELLVVVCVLWFLVDKMWVDTRCYNAPLGYDIADTWRLRLANLSPVAPGYVPDSLYESDDASDLLTLVSRLRQTPEVEAASLSYYSMPYSYGDSWRSLYPLGVDSAKYVGQSYHSLAASPAYFDVFRMTDRAGRPVSESLGKTRDEMVITREAEDYFFDGKDAVGRQISLQEDLAEPRTIAAVLPTFRSNDFDRPENCSFIIMTEDDGLNEWTANNGVANIELCVRMRQPLTDDEMYAFLERVADRLVANNLFVQGATRIADQRDIQLSFQRNANAQKLATMAFLLVNVFFGIVGTFWLRTERRRGEIGLRVALGSTRRGVGGYLYAEGLTLMALTLPALLLFIANLAALDRLDTYRESLGIVRLLATIGVTYLLMAAMIGLGVRISARKAIRMAPAEALRYE